MANDLGKDFASENDLSNDFANEPEVKAPVKGKAPIPSTGTAIARGLGSGVTFGAQPVLAGLGSAALQAASPLTGVDMGPKSGGGLEAMMAAYKQMQQDQMQKNQAAQAAHPAAYGVSQVAGSIPSAVAGGEAGLGAGAQGAMMGEGTYLGDTSDPTLRGAAGSAATGMIMGKGIAAAAPEVLSAAKSVGKTLAAPVVAGAKKVASALGSSVAPEVMQDAYQRGMEGQQLPLFPSNKFNNSPQGRAIANETKNAALSFTNRMKATEQSLGADIGQSIQDAAAEGRTVNVDDELNEFKQQIADGVEANRIRPEEAEQINGAIDSLLYKEAPEEAQKLGTFKTTQKFARNADTGEMEPVATQKTVKVKGANADDLQNTEDVESAIPEEAEEGDQTGQLSENMGQTGNVLGRNVSDTTQLMSPATEGVTRGDLPVQRLYAAKQDFQDLGTSLFNTEGTMPAARQVVKNIQSMINDKLGTAVPDFAQKLQLYNKFLEYLPETIASKGESAQLSGVRLSDMPNPELTVKNSVEDLLTDLNKGGAASQQAQQTMSELDSSLDHLMTIDNSAKAASEIQNKPYQSIFSRLGLNKDQIMSHLEGQAKKANTVNTWMGNKSVDLSAPTSVTDTIKQATGKTGVAAANLAGRFVGNQLYSAGDETLKGVAGLLSNNPETKNLGTAIMNAISKGDTVARNAAIFSAMQNPKARALIDPSLHEDIEKKNQNSPIGTAPSGQSKYSF